MKDTTKAVVRTFLFLIGVYICYQAYTQKPVEKDIWWISGIFLTASAWFAKLIGVALLVVGAGFCAVNYHNLTSTGPLMNFYPGGFGFGLICLIAGGFFLAVAPSKNKKNKDGEKS
ncbi:MAG TPA: hypothetical protein PLG50_08545 [bacterium]|nr:hypothetical protein [bacterium]HQG45694.1 hypothetical protein [bacterium]HQI48618.1 hypothetical protein [bacterium]HQJ63968.1 hypothetical protein [bacterium]